MDYKPQLLFVPIPICRRGNQLEGNQPFSMWALLEIMGHQRFAGLVSEQVIAGQAFIRIDIPENEQNNIKAFTKLFGPSSVYSISPCDESIARSVAHTLQQRPIQSYELPYDLQEKIRESTYAKPRSTRLEGYTTFDETDEPADDAWDESEAYVHDEPIHDEPTQSHEETANADNTPDATHDQRGASEATDAAARAGNSSSSDVASP